MFNSCLGSSFGGCYSPKDYKVSDPTSGGSTSFAHACGSRSGGYYYSPDRSHDVDRYNESTKGNYKYFNPCRPY